MPDLMEEAVENSLVEGKILWLAQTILEVEGIFSGKHDEWICRVGLGERMKQLKSEIERVSTVVAAVRGRSNGNKPLARTLAHLRELMYDTDDLVDELDYFRLQEQVKGRGTTIACANEAAGTDGHGAEQVDASRDNPNIPTSKRRKNWCKEWDHFTEIRDNFGKLQGARCKYCPNKVIQCGGTTGTRGLTAHVNSEICKSNRQAHNQLPHSTSTTDGSPNGTSYATQDSLREKRKRAEEASTLRAASTTRPWDKPELSNRIQQIVFELQGSRGNVCDFLKDSVTCSVQSQSNKSDTRTTTSSSVPRKVHGRDVKKDYIVRVITAAESDVITVLPIVGIVGVGKTAVAQLVYNDPTVISQFERIWVWVSDMFDKVRLTREMLDVVFLESHDRYPYNKESHERMSNYSKLQEILKEHMGYRSKRFLLVLDDVTDRMDNCQWNELLSPLKSNQKKGNVIVITTRNLSVAQRLRTVEPIKLGALQNDDFLLLFKACAFGGDSYQGHTSLNIIGHQIAAKLKGNPLAAETTGEVLKKNLTIDHWSDILKSEGWKSMGLNAGIMHALKLSYDKLPYHLQQCFLYCSLFPDNYKFLAEDLVRSWISQGFVRCIVSSSKTAEQIGRDYLNDLVNSCFFEQVEREDSIFSPQNGPCYVMCGIMHEYARVISRTEFATMCGLECSEILPTIRHVSILTDSVYHKDAHGRILRNKKFEEKMQSIVPLVRNLRTLILIGSYEAFFFQTFQDILQKAHNLRLLHISATQADFHTAVCNSVNPTHLRYLKFENNGRAEALPIPLSKFYHLQVLNAGHPPIVHGMIDLISMRYLFMTKGARPTVTRIGETSNSQGMQDSTNQNYSRSEITHLQSMNKLVQLGVFHLLNVSRAEADGAKLREKRQLEKLLLSWKESEEDNSQTNDNSNPDFEHSSDSEAEEESQTSDGSNPDFEHSIDSEAEERSSPTDDSDPSYRPLINATERERSQMDGSNNSPRSGHVTDMAHDVLEGLEPHQNLKHLQISGYSGSTSPAWLATSVTLLQSLHLEDCGEWKILPSLESLQFLTKLKLSNMQKVNKVSIPPLEELVLINMPELERCSCNSLVDLNSSLKVLKIKQCHALKVFSLFESCKKLKIEHKSWLPCLDELTLYKCPYLKVLNPLPPSSKVCKLDIARVSTLPTMEGSSSEELIIGLKKWYGETDKNSNGLMELDDRILSFHNLSALSRLQIGGCQKLSSISLEGFRQLISLKSLEINVCKNLFSSDALLEHACEDMAEANFNAFPSLEHLKIQSCGITGKWLSVMLRHAPALEEFDLGDCNQISGLLIEGGESSSSNHTSAPRAPSAGNPDGTLTSLTPDGLLRIPSNPVSSLKKIFIWFCEELTFLGNEQGLSGLSSLEELTIRACPKLIQSLVQKYENNDQRNGRWLLPHSLVKLDIDGSPETLQPCFLEDSNCLRRLVVVNSPSLIFLQLHSCTTLEELVVSSCTSLAVLEGNFSCLKELELFKSGLESLQLYSCTTLEKLSVEYCGALIALEGNFTCLWKLKLQQNPMLKTLQLRRCTAREGLRIQNCESLDALEDFGYLGCLRYLTVINSPGLIAYLERLLSQGYELCARLEMLCTDDYFFLTASLFKRPTTSLQRLELHEGPEEMQRLTDEQESALQLLTSLQELRFEGCRNLADLPVGLHTLSSLKRLEIISCRRISRLPEKGLPPSLEELEINYDLRFITKKNYGCNNELIGECRMLAATGSKPRVKIYGRYVN